MSKLRENAKKVIGVGVKKSTSDLLVANCDEFIFYDDLVREQQRALAKREQQRAGNGGAKRADEPSRKPEMEARKAEAIALAVETFEALASERDDVGKIWASVLKSAIKRRKPDFNESYYGFRAFGNLLDEAQARGLLEVGRDDKSGAFVSRPRQSAAAEPAAARDTGSAHAGHGARHAEAAPLEHASRRRGAHGEPAADGMAVDTDGAGAVDVVASEAALAPADAVESNETAHAGATHGDAKDGRKRARKSAAKKAGAKKSADAASAGRSAAKREAAAQRGDEPADERHAEAAPREPEQGDARHAAPQHAAPAADAFAASGCGRAAVARCDAGGRTGRRNGRRRSEAEEGAPQDGHACAPSAQDDARRRVTAAVRRRPGPIPGGRASAVISAGAMPADSFRQPFSA